jgi:SAM-dependent methyltransferase
MASGQPGLNELKEAARSEWTAAAPSWKKWDEKLALQSRRATDLIVERAALQRGLSVLDLASGTGQPALTIAEAVGPRGRVVATDLVPEMLDSGRAIATARGLRNVEFRVENVESLSFANGEFDRVTCRFGLMFFPDVPNALGEIRRVLKPGGRAIFLVWGTFAENPLFGATVGPFQKYVETPPPPPDAPTIFRFADESKLRDTLTSAGLRDVEVTKHSIGWAWPGPPEEAWQAISELAAPFKKLIAALPPEKTDEVMRQVMQEVSRFYDGKDTNFTATVIVGTGVA